MIIFNLIKKNFCSNISALHIPVVVDALEVFPIVGLVDATSGSVLWLVVDILPMVVDDTVDALVVESAVDCPDVVVGTTDVVGVVTSDDCSGDLENVDPVMVSDILVVDVTVDALVVESAVDCPDVVVGTTDVVGVVTSDDCSGDCSVE